MVRRSAKPRGKRRVPAADRALYPDLLGLVAEQAGHHRLLGLEQGLRHRVSAVGGLHGAGARGEAGGDLCIGGFVAEVMKG